MPESRTKQHRTASMATRNVCVTFFLIRFHGVGRRWGGGEFGEVSGGGDKVAICSGCKSGLGAVDKGFSAIDEVVEGCYACE
ncbi:hypothetical protein SLEP1_g28026 [Rubroshorea leprosula]|uniref:Uncharacterized protein n=1 Tax=Rubroshorea leprosula TaxID=152421 RepID=A0AAV5K1P8_9ROSI|nr:hypothetical protein SLEP1_g28026 [Rubroshorea leprosula]